MKSRSDLLLTDPLAVPQAPVWARPRGLVLHDADAAYAAGAALNSLDNLVRQDFAWAGVWRQRLALQSAAAAVNLGGRREEVLARVVGRDASIDLLIDDIREALRGKPYDVVSVAGGWAFRTRTAYADAIATSAAVPDRGVDVTQNEAMVLVSIAYHQPVTRAGVSEILGREVSRDMIGALRDKNMITAGPRSPTAGAPFTYVTTKGFLEHFGLSNLRDLPEIEALQDAGLLSGGPSAEERPSSQAIHAVPTDEL